MSVLHEIMLVLLDMAFIFFFFEQLLLNSPNSALSFLLLSIDQTISNRAQELCRCLFLVFLIRLEEVVCSVG